MPDDRAPKGALFIAPAPQHINKLNLTRRAPVYPA